MPPDSTDEQLDLLLVSSAPPTPVADAVTNHDVARLVSDSRPSVRRRSLRGLGSVGVVAGVIITATGAAAASGALGSWSDWANAPDNAFVYTLPSGIECEQRLGDVRNIDTEMVDAVRDVLAEDDLLNRAGIDRAIAAMRVEKRTMVTGEGAEVDAGYGTSYYPSVDVEYQQAASRAISRAIGDEFKKRGINGPGGSWGGETHCSGLQ